MASRFSVGNDEGQVYDIYVYVYMYSPVLTISF